MPTKAQRENAARRHAEEKRLSDLYDSKTPLTEEQLKDLDAGHWIRVKWTDAEDSVVLVTRVDRLPRKKTIDWIHAFDPQGGFGGRYESTVDIDQITAVLGEVLAPPIVQQTFVPNNEREAAHMRAIDELTNLMQQFLSGLVTLHEFTAMVTAIGKRTPELQVGDIEPATGLRIMDSELVRNIAEERSAPKRP